MNLPLLAGTVSTVLFAASMLPMLHKAVRTKDMASYSLGNIALTNIANAVHSLYVFDLPAGPLWLLHAFYLVASALMLTWCLRYRTTPDAGHLKPAQRAFTLRTGFIDPTEQSPGDPLLQGRRTS